MTRVAQTLRSAVGRAGVRPRGLLASAAALALPLWLQLPAHPDDSANRDEWQRPAAVMDALRVAPGSRVADIGAGSGYFTFHLANRVGPSGRVYAVDILPTALTEIDRRAAASGLTQITTVLGAVDDSRLPPQSLDVILVVNTYHELSMYDAMMRGLWRGLKPGGLLGIIDCEALPGESQASYARHHRIPSAVVREEAVRNGLRFLRNELGFIDPNAPWYAYWYFLIFERPS